MSKLFMPVQLLKNIANWGTNIYTYLTGKLMEQEHHLQKYLREEILWLFPAGYDIFIIGIPVPQLLSQAFHGENPTWDQAGVST